MNLPPITVCLHKIHTHTWVVKCKVCSIPHSFMLTQSVVFSSHQRHLILRKPISWAEWLLSFIQMWSNEATWPSLLIITHLMCGETLPDTLKRPETDNPGWKTSNLWLEGLIVFFVFFQKSVYYSRTSGMTNNSSANSFWQDVDLVCWIPFDFFKGFLNIFSSPGQHFVPPYGERCYMVLDWWMM